ncbi:MAG: hypothetical protein H7Z19_04480, partial [Chitinophagaceae bacterium]|nr:hypothetical protein [Rubrivivax sp.]
MKLSTQLLAAPVLTALVALGVGGAHTLIAQRDMAAAEARFESDLDSLKIVSATQQQLADLHASVYRMQAIVDSFDDGQVKAFRQGLADQLNGVQRVVSTVAADDDPELAGGVASAGTLVEKYRAQADKAVELTRVEINMGVAAMKAAEASFVELSKTMQALVARKETLRAQATAAAQRRERLTLALLGG